jgi:hypothetical protein
MRVPVLLPKEDRERIKEDLLNGTESNIKPEYTKDVPKGFKDFLSDNEERIARRKSKPYFIKDNPAYVLR